MKKHQYGNKFLFLALLALCQFPAIGQESTTADSDKKTTSPGYHKKFDNPEDWAKVWDNPERDKWQKPQEVITALKIKPEDRVADIGAGTGYFTFRIARSYPKVTIYAADVEPDMIKYLKEKAKQGSFANVVAVEIPAREPLLPEKVNLVIVVNTYHHIDDRIQYFKKLKDSLLPDGRLAIVDFTEASPMGPPAEHRISKDKVKAELDEAGYDLSEELDLLPNQHFLIFQLSQ